MKYRRLTNAELKILEKEFVQFLASNHITKDDWLKLKESAMEKVEELIGIFSDIVFEKTLKKIEYLEFKTSHDLKIFHCKKNTITLIGLSVNKNASIDFTQTHNPKAMAEMLKKTDAALQLYAAEKPYKTNREAELFGMLQGGCLILKDGTLFKTLQTLKTSSAKRY